SRRTLSSESSEGELSISRSAKLSRVAASADAITSRLPGEYRSCSLGLRTRQRTEMFGGREGPSRRGRSEDHPPRSSSPILTLRVLGGSAISPILPHRRTDARALDPRPG